MWSGFPLFPEQASSLAAGVDALYLFLVGVTAVFSLGIAGAILLFVVLYRRRHADEWPGEIHGSLALELAWSIIPFVITMIVFVWGTVLFFSANRAPDDSIDVRVVGKRWMWKLQHMTGQREINQLHVPVGRPVRLTLTSEDVIHSFFVPAFRMKKDAVPGRYSMAWFRATKTGTYHLFCAEYCGTEHSRMIGQIVVMDPDDFQAWLQGGPAPISPAAAGQKLFTDLNCITCHQAGSSVRGPSLGGVPGSPVRLQSGQVVTADDAYLRESIVNPAAKIVEGYQPIMPTYQGQVSEEALFQLIAYMRTLKGPQTAPGQEAPVGAQP